MEKEELVEGKKGGASVCRQFHSDGGPGELAAWINGRQEHEWFTEAAQWP